jgi:hypothetical protein
LSLNIRGFSFINSHYVGLPGTYIQPLFFYARSIWCKGTRKARHLNRYLSSVAPEGNRHTKYQDSKTLKIFRVQLKLTILCSLAATIQYARPDMPFHDFLQMIPLNPPRGFFLCIFFLYFLLRFIAHFLLILQFFCFCFFVLFFCIFLFF